jgi:hypothetical protein
MVFLLTPFAIKKWGRISKAALIIYRYQRYVFLLKLIRQNYGAPLETCTLLNQFTKLGITINVYGAKNLEVSKGYAPFSHFYEK